MASALDPTREGLSHALENMALVDGANQVVVNDSTVTMARGHVNNISVNVALSSPPQAPVTVSRSVWSRLLGEWLLPSDPALSLPLRPVPPPATVPKQGAPGTMPEADGSKLPSTCYSSRPTFDTSPEELEDDVKVVPLGHLDIHAHLIQTAGPVRMPHEIYISHLYAQGHGYPCANPKPRGALIRIGDIGFLEGDHFNILENLYCIPKGQLGKQEIPSVSIFRDPEIFEEGTCISGGLDACYIKTKRDSATIEEIGARCGQKDGAILVVTSPAELCEIKNHSTLRKFLGENAAPLFEYLIQNHALPHGSSIYVTTGTILSATWATATHDRPMDPSHNILVLKRVTGEDSKPSYIWTQRGNAQTRTQGRHISDAMDQTLFLRGFLLTAAPLVWKAWGKGLSVAATGPESKDVDIGQEQNPHVSNYANRTSKVDHCSSSSQQTRGGNQSFINPCFLSSSSFPSFSLGTQNWKDVSICALPEQPVPRVYPSYRVNETLLNFTNAGFAITHDDDWREDVKEAASSNRTDEEHACIYENAVIKVQELISTQIDVLSGSVLLREAPSMNPRVNAESLTARFGQADFEAKELSLSPLDEVVSATQSLLTKHSFSNRCIFERRDGKLKEAGCNVWARENQSKDQGEVRSSDLRASKPDLSCGLDEQELTASSDSPRNDPNNLPRRLPPRPPSSALSNLNQIPRERTFQQIQTERNLHRDGDPESGSKTDLPGEYQLHYSYPSSSSSYIGPSSQRLKCQACHCSFKGMDEVSSHLRSDRGAECLRKLQQERSQQGSSNSKVGGMTAAAIASLSWVA